MVQNTNWSPTQIMLHWRQRYLGSVRQLCRILWSLRSLSADSMPKIPPRWVGQRGCVTRGVGLLHRPFVISKKTPDCAVECHPRKHLYKYALTLLLNITIEFWIFQISRWYSPSHSAVRGKSPNFTSGKMFLLQNCKFLKPFTIIKIVIPLVLRFWFEHFSPIYVK